MAAATSYIRLRPLPRSRTNNLAIIGHTNTRGENETREAAATKTTAFRWRVIRRLLQSAPLGPWTAIANTIPEKDR